MKTGSFIIIFFLTVFLPPGSFAQHIHTTSNRALRAYNDGKQAYEFLDLKTAERLLRDAITIDQTFYEAYMVLGEMMTKQRRFSEAAIYYGKAVKIDSLFYKPVFFPLANAEMMSGRYAEALIHYNVYLVQPGISSKNKLLAEKSAADCKFAVEKIVNPVPFNPVNLGDSINTADDEYWPSITVDGQVFMFTRQINSGRPYPLSHEDFYISHLIHGQWSKALPAGYPLNTPGNEGAQSLSSDGRYMYFTACELPDGQGRCDIYFSAFNGKTWEVPVNIGPPVNTSSWESQPSISANGKMLFFTSNRPGGIGGMDLWYSVINEDGLWKAPVNLGKMINTPGDEMSPFIHFDGKTLYFSSNGRTGMGGFDIYFSRMNDDTTWTEPVNLGYPINTYNDEMGLIIDAKGQKAYFSTKREAARGKDIFSFMVYKEIRPDPVSYFKGSVYEKGTGKLLKARYDLVDLKAGKTLVSDVTDVHGSFLVCLPPDANYGLNVSAEGYLFYSENFMFEGMHSATEPFIKRIELSPIRVGEKIILFNVFFEFDSSKITKESDPELNRLTRLLQDKKEIIVEIDGHTDSIGSKAYNLNLSEKRARSVIEYLIGKGISEKRLRFKGFGDSFPIGANSTEEGRKLNRRTEVRIIGINK